MKREFWRGRRVFVTGHTGFKGSWLSHLLQNMDAEVTGFALPPPDDGNLFEAAQLAGGMRSIQGDIRDRELLSRSLVAAKPEVVIHMAAQALVRASYDDPLGTYEVNVLGTANLLEAVRSAPSVRLVVVVTSDKCYEHGDSGRPLREEDVLGGSDPYSSSKGCAELVTAAYRRSFFASPHSPRIYSARAGNVIGGGDRARDRLVPDLVRSFEKGEPAGIRNPDAVRPWQFVLDALNGYLQLAEAGFDGDHLPHAWNFGPDSSNVRRVRWLADAMASNWGDGASWTIVPGDHRAEAHALTLDSSRARTHLGWEPMIDVETAVDWTAEWYKARSRGADARELMTIQSERFVGSRPVSETCR